MPPYTAPGDVLRREIDLLFFNELSSVDTCNVALYDRHAVGG